MQIYVHDIVTTGPLRKTDAEMDQLAAEAASGIGSIPDLVFTGVRLFIERLDGQDQGLLVVEGARYLGKEFPSVAETEELEDMLTTGMLSHPEVQSIGAVRFHNLTDLAT